MNMPKIMTGAMLIGCALAVAMPAAARDDGKDGAGHSSRKGKAQAGPAKAEDVTAGSTVRDKDGEVIGTIESVEAAGAVLATSAGKTRVPLAAFGKNEDGLLLNLAKADLEARIAKAVAEANPGD
ncbi:MULTISPECIES: hypothetical protein [Sphingomonas]|uniref:PRC-barrel domain-containing protein n=1 Tax=Edaphosphingomonas fennica TaxID=114404 RepID=A0A2T4I462_9SPHN|nr:MULTISPECIES: hypothetical protein [Sphingomonas]MDX3883815.1 hypothetical protein [Sphingomonas sp.]PTD24183.1 hypothetical protein CV103_08065 [Sphingomonas fennica]